MKNITATLLVDEEKLKNKINKFVKKFENEYIQYILYSMEIKRLNDSNNAWGEICNIKIDLSL